VKRGAFITFEGPEGSGKTTQIRLLAERLATAGVTTRVTREPGGTRLGEAVRQLLQHDCADAEMGFRAEVLLFCASRAQLVDEVIRPALAGGNWVLCDRFTDSTLAYQGYGRGLPLDALQALNRFATHGLVPDLTILLDIAPDEGSRRLASRAAKEDRIERTERAFHERLRQGYLELARAEPARIQVVTTDRAVADTAAAVWRLVGARWPETAGRELTSHAR